MLVQLLCLTSSAQLKAVLKSELLPCEKQIIETKLQHPLSRVWLLQWDCEWGTATAEAALTVAVRMDTRKQIESSPSLNTGLWPNGRIQRSLWGLVMNMTQILLNTFANALLKTFYIQNWYGTALDLSSSALILNFLASKTSNPVPKHGVQKVLSLYSLYVLTVYLRLM